MSKYKWLKLGRALSFLTIISVVAFWIWDNLSAGYINWFMISLAAVLIAIFFLRNKMADLFLGMMLALLSGYMLLAMTSDLARHIDGTKTVGHPWTYFGFGYTIFSLTAIASLLIAFSLYRCSRLAMK